YQMEAALEELISETESKDQTDLECSYSDSESDMKEEELEYISKFFKEDYTDYENSNYPKDLKLTNEEDSPSSKNFDIDSDSDSDPYLIYLIFHYQIQ
ncbi:hypothetical protein KI387_022371, partial [Taxus chinensis]